MDAKNLTELYEKFKTEERRRILKVITAQSTSEAPPRESPVKVSWGARQKITKFDIDFLLKSVKPESSGGYVEPVPQTRPGFRNFVVEKTKVIRTSRQGPNIGKENDTNDVTYETLSSATLSGKGQRRFHFGSKIGLQFTRPRSYLPLMGGSVHKPPEHPPDTSAEKKVKVDPVLMPSESDESVPSSDFAGDDVSVRLKDSQIENFMAEVKDPDQELPKPKELNLISKVSRHLVPQLPFTLEEFSDDIDPKEFFKQNYTSYHPYLGEIRKLYELDPIISMYHFATGAGPIHNSMSFVLRQGELTTKQVFIPFSIAYLLLHCTPAVKLCFANTMLQDILKNRRPVATHASFKYCNEVLSGLAKEEEFLSSSSLSSKRTLLRKSMFSMRKTTLAVDDDGEAEESPEQSPTSQHASSRLLNTPSAIHQLATADCGLKTSLMMIKAEPEEAEEGGSCSESDDASDSDSKSSSSLEEDEYLTKNKFELMYSEINFKFQRFRVAVVDPFVLDQESRSPILREQVYNILANKGLSLA